jgi:hydrogenase nickel insertion protein HypA
MHEYSVALEIAETALKNAGDKPLLRISLRIGEISGIFEEPLAMYTEIIFREKNLPPPALAIEKVGATFQCACGSRYTPARMFDPCPSCGGFERAIIEGKDCTIESIEVSDE